MVSVIVRLAVCLLSPWVFGQTASGPSPSSAPWKLMGEQRREEMRRWRQELMVTGAGSGMDSWTLAEMVVYSEFLARTHLARVMEEYDLTPEQQKAIEARLAELQSEARAYWKKHLAEYQELRAEMRMNRGSPSFPGPRSPVMTRVFEIMTGQPLHHRNVTPEIEKLLPATQVEASRNKLRKRMENMRNAESDVRLEEVMEMAARAPRVPGIVSLREQEAMAVLAPWEQYVKLFVRVYDLDEEQQATAQSILRDMQGRREEYERSHRENIQKLRNTEDRKARSRMFAELSSPIQKMFDELKTRLDVLPTALQREAAAKRDLEWRAAASRPARTASQPALR